MVALKAVRALVEEEYAFEVDRAASRAPLAFDAAAPTGGQTGRAYAFRTRAQPPQTGADGWGLKVGDSVDVLAGSSASSGNGSAIFGTLVSLQTGTAVVELARPADPTDVPQAGVLRVHVDDNQRTIRLRAIERIVRERHALGWIGAILTGSDLAPLAEAAWQPSADLGLTDAQRRALVGASRAQDVFLIQGPPGTGKTTVIASLVRYFAAERGARVLLASKGHRAIDNALDRLGVADLHVLRLGQSEKVSGAGQKAALANVLLQAEQDVPRRHAETRTALEELLRSLDAAERLLAPLIGLNRALAEAEDELTRREAAIEARYASHLEAIRRKARPAGAEGVEPAGKGRGEPAQAEGDRRGGLAQAEGDGRGRLAQNDGDRRGARARADDAPGGLARADAAPGGLARADDAPGGLTQSDDAPRGRLARADDARRGWLARRDHDRRGAGARGDDGRSATPDGAGGDRSARVDRAVANSFAVGVRGQDAQPARRFLQSVTHTLAQLTPQHSASAGHALERLRRLVDRVRGSSAVDPAGHARQALYRDAESLVAERRRAELNHQDLLELRVGVAALQTTRQRQATRIAALLPRSAVDVAGVQVPRLGIATPDETRTSLEALRGVAARVRATLPVVQAWGTLLQRPGALADVLIESAAVVAATAVGVNSGRDGARTADLEFDVVIVDEAGQAQLTDLVVPLSRARTVVLVGDHQQLPPYVDGDLLERCTDAGIDTAWLETSLFEYLWARVPPTHRTLLDLQFRMPQAIADFLGRWFYGGELASAASRQHGEPVCDAFGAAVVFVDTSAEPGRGETPHSPGFVNRCEARVVAELIARLPPEYVSGEGVGVIAPYSAQVAVVRQAIGDVRGLSARDPWLLDNVATVDSFQGQERDVIVVSLTRSNPAGAVGFLTDLKRLNVTLSRARRQLVIVGDLSTLCASGGGPERRAFAQCIGELAEHVRQHGELLELAELQRRLGG